MKTIVVMSRKGGAGKTTLAVNLALRAQAARQKVVLADVDPQHSSAEALKNRSSARLVIATTAAKLFALKMDCQRSRCDLMVIDTPPAPEADVISAINLADLCVAVARPTFLDLTAVTHSIQLIRRLGKQGLIVLNQCPPARLGEEAPAVANALEALRLSGLPVAPEVIHARGAYQTALARGQSQREFGDDPKAIGEIDQLYSHVMGRTAANEPEPRPWGQAIMLGAPA